MGANRPPPKGAECRLGSSIIKTACPKKMRQLGSATSSFKRVRKRAAHRLLLSSNHHVDFSRREYNQTASIYPRMMRAASVLAWMLIFSQR